MLLELKKISKTIDEAEKKNDFKIDITSLISYMISKINRTTSTENSILELESILKKLLKNDFTATVKIFCYYIIANFNQEFSPEFFSSISKPLTNDAIALDKFDININALRNFMILSQKELIENIPKIESLFKSPKYDMNFIINAFYFSNYPMLLLNLLNKVSTEDLRQYKDFLARFYLEFGKLLFFNKLQDGSFLNLAKMISRILSNFKCLPELSTKEKICNSVLIPLAEYLVINLEELVNLMISFDNKLLVQAINLPIDLYKIYNFYRDYNNPNKKYEEFFHLYISFLFKEMKNIVDPDIYSEVTKTLCEFKIIGHISNPECYSTEIIENISKFFTFNEQLNKTMWFDNNIKNLSQMVNYIENTEVRDLIIFLLRETKYISNHNDRIITLFNLFNRLISLSLDYENFVEKESLISSLFENDWLINLIKDEKLQDKENIKWRNDIFTCLIESVFHAKKILIKSCRINEYINLMKICEDVVEFTYKILDWQEENDTYKMYLALLEELCIFLNDNFFEYAYKEKPKYKQMKEKIVIILDELFKRFEGHIKWDELLFQKEEGKYYALFILCKYLDENKNIQHSTLLGIIFNHLKEIIFDYKSGYYIEKLFKCALIMGIRLDPKTKEKILIVTAQINQLLKEKEKQNQNQLISDLINLSEKIKNYIYKNKDSPPLALSNKDFTQIDNDYYLVVNRDIESNLEIKKYDFNNLFLMNITSNSFNVIEINSLDNSSIYLEYFKNYFYYPILEFNNEYCYMLIDSKQKYISNQWKLISGISDPIHIYYRHKTNIETRESEVYIKCFNSTSITLNNLSFITYLSENLLEINKATMGDLLNSNSYFNGIEYKAEILPPYSYYEFYFKIYSKIFDINYISVEAQFDMKIDNKNQFTMKCEPFSIPLSTFLIPDNYSLYDVSRFDMFFNSLDYIFSITCKANLPPESIIKSLSHKLALIEYISNKVSFQNEKNEINKIIKKQFHDYYNSTIAPEEIIQKEQSKTNENDTFKIKLSSYCVFNFWVYLYIRGEYDSERKQSILYIDIKSNDLKGLTAIAKEKYAFIKELFNNIIIL